MGKVGEYCMKNLGKLDMIQAACQGKLKKSQAGPCLE
jgi:hypothetical protein